VWENFPEDDEGAPADPLVAPDPRRQYRVE